MSDALTVVAKPHPLRADTVHVTAPEGLTLAELVGPRAAAGVQVTINGETIPREHWARVRPKAGATVNVLVAPLGGGGDNKVLRTVLTIGIIVASIYTGGLATAAYGEFYGALAAAGVSIAGNLLLNALIPPPMPQIAAPNAGASSFNRLASITGTANRANPFGAIPRVLGKMKLYPPLAAVPATELLGDNQYLRMLMMLGYGDLVLSDMQIGDTPLDQFEGVRTELGTAEAPPGLYAFDIEEDATTTPALDNQGDTATRTTAPDTDEISVDLLFPQGLFGVNDDGDTIVATTQFSVLFRAAGTVDWFYASPANPDISVVDYSSDAITNNGYTTVVTGGARQTLRVGLRWPVPTGQYEVQVQRGYTEWGAATDDARFGDAVWGALRSIHYTQASSVPNSVVLALMVQANDQLNGAVNQFNLVAQSILATWDGTQWLDVPTSNPAWIAVEILTGAANHHRLDKNLIDVAAFKAWADECDAAGREFNAVIEAQTTAGQLLKAAFAAGRAAPARIDGLWSVVRDVPQTVPVQHITPRNSWGFAGTRNFPDRPHALRVQFTNIDADYQQDEIIVYDDGYDATNATRFETLPMVGAMHYAQAWKDARYHLAVARLRPDTYTVSMDVENLVAQRGELVKVAHDVISAGLGWGRIKRIEAIDANGDATMLVLDEALDFTGMENPVLRVRRADNTSALIAVAATGATRGNLVENGFGLSGDNTNFTDFTRVPDPAAPGGAAFEITGNPNLLRHSQDFNAAGWIHTRVSVVPNAAKAPDGSLTADKVVTAASTGRLAVRQQPPVTDGEYVNSIYAKAAEWTVVTFFVDSTAITDLFKGASTKVDLATGESSNPDLVTTESAGNGWWRLQINATYTDAPHGEFELALCDPQGHGVNNSIGDGVSGVYVWGGQFEAGAVATQYNRTTDAPSFTCAPDTPIPIDAARDYLAALALEFAPRNLLGPDAGAEYSGRHEIHNYVVAAPLSSLGLQPGGTVFASLKTHGDVEAEAGIEIVFKDANGAAITTDFVKSDGSTYSSIYVYDPIVATTYTYSSVFVPVIPANAATIDVNSLGDTNDAVPGATLFARHALLSLTEIPYETTIAPNYQLTVLCQDANGNTTGTLTLESGATAKSYAQLQDAIAATQWPAGTTQILPSVTITTADGSPATVRTAGWSLTPLNAIDRVNLPAPAVDLSAGDLFLYGEAGQEAIDCILTRIKPGADLTAQLTLVDAAPGVHDADAGPVPPFTSAVTGTGRDCEAPPPPAITAVLGGYEDDGAHGPPADDGGLKLPSYKFQVGRG